MSSMSTVTGVLMVALAIGGAALGCSGESAPEAKRFAGTDPIALLRESQIPEAWAVARSSAITRLEPNVQSKVYLGVRAALDRAVAAGLTELYGAEEFPEYRAWFVFTAGGRHVALFASEEFAAGLENPGRIPSIDVPSAVVERLRARVSTEWPTTSTVDLSSSASDAPYVLVHVYRGGETGKALLYNPAIYFSQQREGFTHFAGGFQVTNVMRAIQVAMPPAFFPAAEEDPKKTYGMLKPY